MKTDRLMAITLYLMNHKTVSASALAARFEVSKRTIQRDMEALSKAGIPIVSAYGVNGGYGVMDGFRLAKQIAGADDYRNIITALRGLSSAYGSKDVNETLHKALLSMPHEKQLIFVDFSAAGENPLVEKYLRELNGAIARQSLLRIRYTDAAGNFSSRVVEPLALSLRWYAWYLFAYCREKQDYRLFKLQRITECEEVSGSFSKKHDDIEARMEQSAGADSRKQYHIRLRCTKAALRQVQEYLRGTVIKEYDNGDTELLLPDRPFERMWFSLLLGFGNEVEVLKPASLRQMLRDKAKEIYDLYLYTTGRCRH